MSDFDRLAANLEGQLDSLVSSVLERVREKGAGLDRRNGDGWGQVDELTRESLAAQLRSFRRGLLPESCPEVDAAAVAALAKVAELEVLLNGYRACQVTLWEAWFALVEDSPKLAVSQRREFLSRGSDFFFRYADLLGDYVADAYQHEVELLRGNGEQRRFRAIKELIDGEPRAGSSLDFELDRHHLGLIAWGEDPAGVARRLADELGRPLLSVRPLERTQSCWAWISGTRPLDPAEERVLAGFEPATGRLALGLEGFGEAGFRASHRQAQRARRFARVPGPALLRYEDVVVEALASENEDDARAFVAYELRGIEDDSPTSQRLRETLAAYFASEYNAASAGATLGVHQQTVANRLRVAEERLGRKSIGARRVELEMALRLRTLLSSSSATG
jgi:PucR-like helix-turn-helix protein/diguanylate cyclase with GGDEF domain